MNETAVNSTPHEVPVPVLKSALLLSLVLFLATAPATAAPWSRLKLNPFARGDRNKVVEQAWAEEREIEPYLIRSEFPLNDVQDLVQELGDLRADLEQTLRLTCEPREIQIHLFSSKRSYVQYLTIRVPEGTKRQALYVPGTDADRVYAYRNRDLETDVRHEATHALLHSALPYVPIWLDEGIAEYFEVPRAMRVKGHSHRSEVRKLIHWKCNIERLEAKRKLLDMDGDDYRDSWAIVNFLLNGPSEAREALDVYFEEIISGAAPTPLSQQLRRKLPNLDQAILDHLSK